MDKDEKFKFFIEDVRALCQQYNFKLSNITVKPIKDNERTEMDEEPAHRVQGAD